MVLFTLLKEAAGASGKVEKAIEFIRGGPMTKVLEEIGTAHLDSAIEHLRQAQHSRDPERRFVQATGDLQNAYILFARAASAGPSRKLRILFDLGNLRQSRSSAADCASAIALIQWTIGESETNRRLWLDRVARQLALFYKEMEAGWRMYNGERYMGYGAEATNTYLDLRTLEANTLPSYLHRAAKLRFEDADRYRLPTDEVEFSEGVILSRKFITDELARSWTDVIT